MFGLGVQELVLNLVIAMFFLAVRSSQKLPRDWAKAFENLSAPVRAERMTRMSI
jgi:hypothetical protein